MSIPTLLDSTYFVRYGHFDDKVALNFLKLMKNDRINAGLDLSSDLIFLMYMIILSSTIYASAIYVDYHEKYLGVVTFAGRMNFALTYNRKMVSSNQIREIAIGSMSLLAIIG